MFTQAFDSLPSPQQAIVREALVQIIGTGFLGNLSEILVSQAYDGYRSIGVDGPSLYTTRHATQVQIFSELILEIKQIALPES